MAEFCWVVKANMGEAWEVLVVLDSLEEVGA